MIKRYVHNNIFFSHVIDTDIELMRKESDTISGAEKAGFPLSSAEKDVNEQATYASTNSELIGAVASKEADVSGLNTLLMARVDYRGHRLVAQSILLDISDSTLYGSIDNGEKNYWNQEMHSKIAEAAKRLHLEKHSVHDESGNAFMLAAPATSLDHRRCILHFPRATPRDANNAGPGSLFCILRPELITAYCRLQEAQKDAVESVPIADSEGQNIVVDEKLVGEASHFLEKDVVPNFINDYVDYDRRTLTEKLHKYGINVGYIGNVAERVADPNLQSTFSNEIIVRSAKYILKDFLRKTEDHDHNHVISHFLNCLFGNVAKDVDASLTDSSIQIKEFAKLKYKYVLKDNAKEKHIQDLMQDNLCQKVGINIEKRTQGEPIQIADISGLKPVVKWFNLRRHGSVRRLNHTHMHSQPYLIR